MAKAQLTFEFLILLGGVLLIAVFIIGMLYFSVKNQNVCSAIQTQVSQLDTYKIVVTVPNPCEKYDNTNNITITGTVLISDEVKNNFSLKNPTLGVIYNVLLYCSLNLPIYLRIENLYF